MKVVINRSGFSDNIKLSDKAIQWLIGDGAEYPNIKTSDPLLIACVEELGLEASAPGVELVVVDTDTENLGFEFGPRSLRGIDVWIRVVIEKGTMIAHAQRRDGLFRDIVDLTPEEKQQIGAWLTEEVRLKTEKLDAFKKSPFKSSLKSLLAQIPDDQINLPCLNSFIQTSQQLIDAMEAQSDGRTII